MKRNTLGTNLFQGLGTHGMLCYILLVKILESWQLFLSLGQPTMAASRKRAEFCVFFARLLNVSVGKSTSLKIKGQPIASDRESYALKRKLAALIMT